MGLFVLVMKYLENSFVTLRNLLSSSLFCMHSLSLLTFSNYIYLGIVSMVLTLVDVSFYFIILQQWYPFIKRKKKVYLSIRARSFNLITKRIKIGDYDFRARWGKIVRPCLKKKINGGEMVQWIKHLP